ncbi:MAG: flagellar M-ring protein FliF C-terminal domain-containing protein, partial [Desulfatirhabdiaceae bacterium]
LEYQEKIERGLETRVMTMLEQALGPGKAIVRVSCALDFKRQEKTEERYYPDNKVVRSEQIYNESSVKSEKTPMGVPGTQAEFAEKLANNTSENTSNGFQKQDQTTNYEIGKMTSHTVEPIGKMTGLSVAVLVDGTYKKAAADGDAKWDYIPRSPEEMSKLKSIVIRAVNLTESRGDEVEVVNIPFNNASPEEVEEKNGPDWIEKMKQYSAYVQYGFSLLFLLLTFVFVIRPLIQWITGERLKLGESSLLGELPRTVQDIENEYRGAKMRLPMMEKASKVLLTDNPATVQLLRDWLKQGQNVT